MEREAGYFATWGSTERDDPRGKRSMQVDGRGETLRYRLEKGNSNTNICTAPSGREEG